jgi:hypothetical protein
VPFWAFTAMIVLLDLKYPKDAEGPVALADRSEGK